MSQSGKPSGFNLMDTMVRVFPPDPPAEKQIEGNENQAKAYKYWQRQVLISSIVGYAAYYFVRKNMGITMPAILKQTDLTESDLGLYLTLHGVIYGISKFVNGFFGDRVNARTFMVTGLFISAALNICFGMSSMALWLGFFWMINGWAQGMGFPPCARLITNWFNPKELTTKFSIWNTSHSIGAAFITILCGYLVSTNWRLGFFVPAILAIAVAIYLKFSLPDLPESVGLPEIEGTEEDKDNTMSEAEKASFRKLLWEKVFTNKYIWIISLANFFVYVVRYGMFDWTPTILDKVKGYELEKAGWMTAAFEISGIAGMLLGGVISDRLFGGRGSRTCIFYMIFCAVGVWLFWKLPNQTPMITTGILCMIGFFIYGPQALVGPIVSNLATKRAAASAVGLTGLFAYASTTVSGWGMGYVAEHYGWDVVFKMILVAVILGSALFVFAWTAPRDTYNSSAK